MLNKAQNYLSENKLCHFKPFKFESEKVSVLLQQFFINLFSLHFYLHVKRLKYFQHCKDKKAFTNCEKSICKKITWMSVFHHQEVSKIHRFAFNFLHTAKVSVKIKLLMCELKIGLYQKKTDVVFLFSNFERFVPFVIMMFLSLTLFLLPNASYL